MFIREKYPYLWANRYCHIWWYKRFLCHKIREYLMAQNLSLVLSCNELKLGVTFVHFALIRAETIFIHFL